MGIFNYLETKGLETRILTNVLAWLCSSGKNVQLIQAKIRINVLLKGHWQ
jgi:hypothetical protein